MTRAVRIIGIDPGLRRCGWGIIEAVDNRLSFVAGGTITPPIDGALAERLAALATGLGEVLDQDSELLPIVQAGARSRGFRGPLWSDQEARLRHFHAELDCKMAQGDAA